MATISGTTPIRPLSQQDTSQAEQTDVHEKSIHADNKNKTPKPKDTGPVVDETLAIVDSSDELSAQMTQFRNRKDLEKKSGEMINESFARVLDEDVLPKSRQILEISGLKEISIQDLLRQIRTLFPDDSDLVLVLRELLRRYKLDATKRKKIEELLRMVESEANPRALKAGINSALKARLFGHMLSLSPILLRATYRRFLENDSSEVVTYEEWVTTYGYQRRATILDFIEGALLTDIDANDPSCSHLEFGQLLGKLNQIKLLRSADHIFIQNLLNNDLVKQHNANEAEWLVFLLMLLQFPHELDSLLLDVLGEAIYLSPHKQRAALLQIIRQACKALPPRLFADETIVHELSEQFSHFISIAHHYELIDKRRGQ